MDMTMASSVPDWLSPVAWTYLTLTLLSAVVISVDVHLRRRRHAGADAVSGLVWISSALYLGPVAVLAYLRRGRDESASTPVTRADDGATALGVLPGGGASAVAHLLAVPLVAAAGWTIAGLEMWPMILVIAVLAIAMLTIYERVSRRPGSTAGRVSTGAAVVAAVLTVVAFDVGMVGWMLVLHVNNLMPAVSEGSFWFLMQIGVLAGLLTGYPAVRWLARRDQSAVPA